MTNNLKTFKSTSWAELQSRVDRLEWEKSKLKEAANRVINQYDGTREGPAYDSIEELRLALAKTGEKP